MGNLSSAVPTIIGSVGSALGVPGLNTVTSVFSAVQDDRSRRQNLRAEQNLALQQLQQRQALDQQQAAQDAALDRQERALQSQKAEEERKAALRRAISRQRASFGASGIGSSGGSSEAVLLGLFEESDDDRIRRDQLDNLRNNALSQNLSQRNSLNVLQRTQLQEKQNLRRASEGF